jgi:hypothetical protein
MEMFVWDKIIHFFICNLYGLKKMLRSVKNERNILRKVKRRKANWIVHILHRNCLLKHIIAYKIEVMVVRQRRRKHLLDDHKEKRGYW